jgi:hypothetical protein
MLIEYGSDDTKRYRQDSSRGPPSQASHQPASQHPGKSQQPVPPPRDRKVSVVTNYYKVELQGCPPVYQYHLEFEV